MENLYISLIRFLIIFYLFLFANLKLYEVNCLISSGRFLSLLNQKFFNFIKTTDFFLFDKVFIKSEINELN